MLSLSRAYTSGGLLWVCSLISLISGCSSLGSSHRVPAAVEERQATKIQSIWSNMPQAKPAPERVISTAPDAPGYYTVKPGDTLIRIGLDHGQNWRDLAKWNNLDNPNSLEVGQVLRVQTPVSTPLPNPIATRVAPATNTETNTPGVIVRPVTSTVIAPPAPSGESSPPPSPPVMSGSVGARPGTSPTPPSIPTPMAEGGEEIAFSWPALGGVLNYFDESKTLKGLDIGGKAGDPVLASADGKVVYAGNGVRGYGNLIILKHNNTYLSAYAHNQSLLVKEDQSVKKGQKIAEMGNTDSDQVNLHFEIRKLGKPIDPLKYLPAR